MADHLYRATVAWNRGDGEFAKGRYSRGHTWRFDGGIAVPASASPQVVPKPYVNEAAVDPEEAFIASLSSCHMLTFLDLARRTLDNWEAPTGGYLLTACFATGRWAAQGALSFLGSANRS